MKAEEWVTDEGMRSDLFIYFGGLAELTKNATSEANSEGGVKSLRVVSRSKEDDVVLIEVEVTFNSNKKTTSIEAWKIENGTWKVTPK